MPVPEVLRKLLTAPGPSGYEQAAAVVFREAASAFADVSHDSVGSTVARVKGTADGPLLAVFGHIDEIGLIVHHIDDDGFLYFSGVGGWDPIILVGQRVEIATRDGAVPGVVGKKPIHLLKDEERKQVPELRNLHIDIGAADGDEARRRVRIGDVAVIAGEPLEYPNARIVSRSLDNRLGCFVAYEAARLVSDAGGAPGDVCAVAATQEEITFGGSATSRAVSSATKQPRRLSSDRETSRPFGYSSGSPAITATSPIRTSPRASSPPVTPMSMCRSLSCGTFLRSSSFIRWIGFLPTTPGTGPDRVAIDTRWPTSTIGSQPPTPVNHRNPSSSMWWMIRPISSMWPTIATDFPPAVPGTRATVEPTVS